MPPNRTTTEARPNVVKFGYLQQMVMVAHLGATREQRFLRVILEAGPAAGRPRLRTPDHPY